MRAMAQFEETAKKCRRCFPTSLKGVKLEGDYSASPKIWEDKAGFDAKIATFAKAVAEAKGKIKDLDTLKAPSPRSASQCGGCHETFRLKTQR